MRLKRRAERAEGIVELQKKVSEILGIELEERRDRLMAMGSEHRGLYSVPSICAGLGIGRASFYRWQRPSPRAVTERMHPRALTVNERHGSGCSKQRTVLRPSPGEVYATLLDEGRYLCSERSMYRILAEHQQVKKEEISGAIPVIKPELSLVGPTRCGHGILPSSWGRRSGRIFTST